MMAHDQKHLHPHTINTSNYKYALPITSVFKLGLLALHVILLLSIKGVSGTVECEELAIEDCAFAVSSSGARCVLEKQVLNTNSAPDYKCQTSVIMAERQMEWIETEECISACGLQRLTVGLSTDALLEGGFTTKFCFSTDCRTNCPNINDLYVKLAAEEGIYLPGLCEALKEKAPRKLMSYSIPTTKLLQQNSNKLGTTTTTTEQLQVVGTYNTPLPSPIPSPSPAATTPPSSLPSSPSPSPSPSPSLTPSLSPSPSISNNNYDYYINSGNVGTPPITPPSPSPSQSNIPTPTPTPSPSPSTYVSNIPSPTPSPILSPYLSNPTPTPSPSSPTPTLSPSFGFDTDIGSTPTLAPSPSLFNPIPTPTLPPTLAPSPYTFDYITSNTPVPSPSSYISSYTTPTLAPSLSPSYPSPSPTPIPSLAPSNTYDYNYYYNTPSPSITPSSGPIAP